MSSEHPLGALIETMREVNGWSHEDVAKDARMRGFKVSKSAAHRIETVKPELMRKDQIEWMSAVFGLGERQIIAAFLASMGYTLALDGPSTVEDAVRADTRLSSDEKEILFDVVRGMRRRARAKALTVNNRDENETETTDVNRFQDVNQAGKNDSSLGGDGSLGLGNLPPSGDPNTGVQDSEREEGNNGIPSAG
jgi:hypothetical protein